MNFVKLGTPSLRCCHVPHDFAEIPSAQSRGSQNAGGRGMQGMSSGRGNQEEQLHPTGLYITGFCTRFFVSFLNFS